MTTKEHIRPDIAEILEQIDYTHYSPPPFRMVAGVSLTFEQLEILVDLVRDNATKDLT